ncbi:hypothetical protein P0082_00440 [Candidatus Haliotispira prima]|uniref:Uncharacterized protein n=1 Tax=Candidatus Haliotispira prima TaxID=3034016 RepID=A0ABY8MH66_9SPIO|nr:hypothetical protein P0082_00440 [Candidatus Haliotispira prima]
MPGSDFRVTPRHPELQSRLQSHGNGLGMNNGQCSMSNESFGVTNRSHATGSFGPVLAETLRYFVSGSNRASKKRHTSDCPRGRAPGAEPTGNRYIDACIAWAHRAHRRKSGPGAFAFPVHSRRTMHYALWAMGHGSWPMARSDKAPV